MSVPLPRTLCEAFQHTAAQQPEAIAIRVLGDGAGVSWRDYAKRVRSIAAGLAGLGVGRGDTVALMLTNRPEFHLIDTAILHMGATPFSMYNTNPAEMLGYLFDNAENTVVICEQQFLPVVLSELEAAPAADFDFDGSWQAVEPEDLVTIIYTSGTTGPPRASRSAIATSWPSRR